MKRLILLLLTGFLFLEGYAQPDSTKAPYQKFPFYPPVKLLLPDSSSFFSKDDLPKKTAVMLMLFNPGCEHCRHETEEIIKNIDEFKDIQIVMATSMPFDSMTHFCKKYDLARFKNIVVGQDTHFFLITFFDINQLPFLAFYNKKRELISVFTGSLPVRRILDELHK